MNKHLHRIVFNAARGLRMAVQETARSAGKAASGTTSLAVAALATLAAGPAVGQIAADPNAPGSLRPTVLAAPGGAALVNIQTPSAAGVSRNLYRQFDVAPQGAVLNNSRTAAQTQLAGQVAGNPWLARGPARVILNEVNSADPSRLRGYVEVAGQRAEVVIANPSGIQVDGAGFINTSRATLTTGTPQFGAAGTLDGFLVRGGTIIIDGAGLDAASTDYVSILSRALRVNAGIWASELKAVAGTDGASGTSAATPAFALDVSALGGMYAGKIALVGTGAGVGVRNAGHIGAGAGGLVVTAAGRLENTGTLEGGRVELASGEDIHNRGGRIHQAGDMALQLAGTMVRNSDGGQIGTPPPAVPSATNASAAAAASAPAAAPDAAAVVDPAQQAIPPASAAGSITAQGRLHNEGGRIDAAGTIVLQAHDIDNAGGALHIERLSFDGRHFGNAGGQLSVRGDFSVNAERFDNAGGQLQAGHVAIASRSTLDNRGGQIATTGADLALRAGTLANAGGRIEVAGNGRLSVDADQFDGGDGTLQTGGALALRAREATHAGQLQAGQVTVEATRLRNSGQIVQTGTEPMRLAASEVLDNRGGSITGHGVDMAMQTAHLSNHGGQIAHAGTGQLSIQAERLDGGDGAIASNAHLSVQAGQLQQGGRMQAAQIEMAATRLDNRGGDIVQTGEAAMRIRAKSLDNSGGHIATNATDLRIETATLDNRAGSIAHAGLGQLDLRADRLEGDGGHIASNGALHLQATEIAHGAGAAMSAEQITLEAGRLANAAGEIVQRGSQPMRIAVREDLDNRGGRIVGHANDMELHAGHLANAGGSIAHAGSGVLGITTVQLDGGDGRILGGGSLQMQGTQLTLAGSVQARQITIAAATLDNRGEIVQTGDASMRLSASGRLANQGGRIAANAQDLQIRAGVLDNAGGTIEHAGTGRLQIQADRLDGNGGRILGNGLLQIEAQQIAHGQGASMAAEQIAVVATRLDNQAGEIVQRGAQAMSITASETLDNRGGRIAGNASDMALQSAHIANDGGHVVHAGSGRLAIDAGRLAGGNGHITSNGMLALQADTVANQGSMQAAQIGMAARILDNRGGQITQTGNQAMRLHATEALDNTGGSIAGNAQDMELRSASITNGAGHIEHAGSGQLTIHTETLHGGDGSIVGNAALALHAGQITHGGHMQADRIDIRAATLDNRGGQIVQTGTEDMRVAVTAQLDNRGGRIAGNARDMDITAATLANAGGEIAHAGTGRLAIAAEQLDADDGRILGNGQLRVQARSVSHSGTMQADRVVIEAGTLANTGLIAQTGDATMQVRTTGMLDNRGGRIVGNGHDMALQAEQMANAGGHIAHAGSGQLAITAAQFDNGNGEATGNGTLALQAIGVHNAGRMHAARIAIDASDLANSGEILQTSAGQARVTVSATLDNRAGLIGTAAGTGADLTLSAAQVLNQGGRLQADGMLALRAATDLHNTGGLLRGGNALDVALGGQLRNASGALEATGAGASLALQAAAIDNQDGRIVNAGNGASRIAAASIVNAGAAGLIGSNGALQLSAATLDNLAGAQLSAGQALDLAVTEQVRNRGSMAGDGGLTMAQANARLDNAGGSIVAAGPVHIAVAQVQNDGGRIATATGSQGDLTIATGSLSNLGGTLSSDRDLSLQIGGDHAHAGLAHAARDLALTVGGALRNDGLLRAGGTLAAQAQSMDNTAGASIEAGQVVLHAAGALHNGGEIGANSAALHADALTNQGAITAGALSITARTLDNTGPQALIGATDDLALRATQALSNTDGASVYAGRDIRITTGALLNRSATVEAGRHIAIDAATVLNERPGVAVQRVVTLEENHTMRMPSWWQNRDSNGRGYTPEGTNYSAYQVSYVNPADILEQSTVYTPDGYAIGRVVVRTHANDTVFFSGRAGRASADGKHWGQAERMSGSDGTRVLYYTARQDGMPNPDQVPGVTSGVWEDAQVHTMDTSRVAFSPAYGSCSTNCVRFVAPLDYADPNTTIIRDTQSVLGPSTSLSELQRDAHVTATEDRLAPGAGTAGRIAAGGDIRVNFSGWMLNDHSDIVAGGALALHGSDGAAFENRATTLLRTWRFDGTHHYANGTSAAYRQPDKTEVIGSIGAAVSGQQLDIQAGSIRNVDTSAGSHANLTADLRLSSGATPQAGTTRRIQNGMLAAQSGSGVSVHAQAVDQAAAGATVGRSEDAAHGGTAQGAGVALTNGADIATRAQASTGGSGLFQLQPAAAGATLYTTHPRFANAKPWVSSDSMLQTLGLHPALVLKRLGDGFMEQQRIREQVTAQTGRRHLAGYSDDDAQYAALLNAGASFAQALDLRVGVALTAAQMAQLTSDIVWLERQSVTLPDGSTRDVLAPRLYLAHLGEGTVRPHGALVTGDDVRLQGQDILNRGGVIGQASTGRTVLVAGRDIVNQGGTVQGQDVALVAARDVRNESLAITQDWSASNARASVVGSHTSLSNTTRIEAGRTLQIQAGQDVQDTAGHIAAGGTASVQAGRDIVFGTLDSGHDSRMQMGRASVTSSSRQAHAGQIGAGGDLVLSAGRDLQLNGTQAHAGGDALLAAGRELSLQAVASTSSNDLRNDPAGSRYRQTRSETTVQGASVQAAGDLVARAGLADTGSLRTVGSTLAAQGAASLSASGDVTITEARESRSIESFQRGSRSGLLSRKTTVDETSHRSDTTVGSSVGGSSVTIAAGHDLTVRASEVIADARLHMAAGGDLRIEAGEDRFADSSLHQEKKSGLFSSGGLGVTIGSQKISGAQQSQSTQAVASTVGSVAGDVTLVAGGHYRQTGSDVMAPDGVVTVAAQSIRIEEARETLTQQAQHKAGGSGLTLAITGGVVDALQGVVGTARAMSGTGSARAQALGAASLALDAYGVAGAANALMQEPSEAFTQGQGSLNLSLSLGSYKSSSQSALQADSARASSVRGRDVHLSSTGAGAASTLSVQGSDITAARDASLVADGAIDIGASRSTRAAQGANKSSSASIGVSIGADGLLFNIGASQGKGRSNGTELTHRNSRVSAGNRLTLQSGGDTTIAGGVLAGDAVVADIGGALNIESLQDTAQSAAKNTSAGFSLSVGWGVWSASVNVASARAQGDYASVTEQSGIHAGDGGFDIRVQGATALNGAAITSTQTAVDAQRNRLDTASLALRDIDNHDDYRASGFSVGVGMGNKNPGGQTRTSGSAGAASASGSQSSTTRAGVSGIAGDHDVRTGDDGSNALKRSWDTQALVQDMQAQARITQEFGQHASRAVGDYAQQKYAELMNSDPAEAAKWAEGGAYRVAAHAAVGALTGGLNGLVGAGASAYVTATIGQSIDDMDVPDPVKQMLGAASAAAVGAIVGGPAGAAPGFTVDLNNRQQHSTERQALQANAKAFATHLQKLGYSSMTEERALAILQEQVDNRIDSTQASRLDTATMDPYIKAQASKFLNALSSSLGSYDDGRGHQVRYFTNATADNERLLGDRRDSSINAVPHFPPIDYVTLQGGVFGINGGISINLHNSEVFLGGAKSNISSNWGSSIVVGRILQEETDPNKRAELISKTLGGASAQTSFCAAGLCAGINQSIGPKESNPATAVEFGIGTPGISGGVGISIPAK
ncbi:hemagglutinin repeat-containing protein [Pseudorhodoferax sp. LjRoot39]|uniref:hemagglutinin repeat-containing protein n=1 Tax=Pseudorhodoferax sp. LjRoot39 TaxID=3342328 RepID=UPI003ECFC7D9